MKKMKKNKYVPKNPRDKRYYKNYKSVKKLCKILGLQIIGFDPNWLVMHLGNPSYYGGSMDINDGLMGRLSTLFGLPWEFDFTDENIKSSIESNKSHIQLVGEWGKSMKSEDNTMPIDFGDISIKYQGTKEKMEEDIKRLQLELEMRKKRIKDPKIIKEE